MKDNSISMLAMISLALYPLLCYYVGPANISYGQILMMLFVALSIVKHSNNRFDYPKGYFIFWGYIAVITFLMSMRPIDIIPGGVNFFVWSLVLGVSSRLYNEAYLRKAMQFVLLASSVVLMYQIVIYETTGVRICAVLPLSSQLSYANLTYQEMVLHQTNSLSNRFSSFFMEPSYFAQYCLCFLVIEMFCCQNRGKLLSKMTIVSVLVLLIIRSGVGLIGLVILGLAKIWSLKKMMKKSHFLVTLFLLIVIGGFAINNFLSSDYVLSLMERSEEFESENSSAYYRIVRGFLVFDALPLLNKIIGISSENLLSLNNLALSSMASGGSMLYFNGFQTILIRSGITGLLLLSCILINSARKGDSLTRMCLFLLLSISLMEQIYLMAPMLLLMVVATGNNKQRFLITTK